MIAHPMNQNFKHGIISFIGGIGLVVLIAGIFINSIPFNYALFIAISLWMLSGVVAKFMGVTRQGEVSNTNWRHALVSFLSIMGVIVLLSGIFLDVPFYTAIVAAFVLWMLAGVVSSFLGVSNSRRRSRRYNRYVENQYNSSKQAINNFPSQSSYSTYGQPSPKATATASSYNLEKNLCSNCGSSMEKDDTFCAYCGSSNTKI